MLIVIGNYHAHLSVLKWQIFFVPNITSKYSKLKISVQKVNEVIEVKTFLWSLSAETQLMASLIIGYLYELYITSLTLPSGYKKGENLGLESFCWEDWTIWVVSPSLPPWRLYCLDLVICPVSPFCPVVTFPFVSVKIFSILLKFPQLLIVISAVNLKTIH